MKIVKPGYYDSFTCIANECPFTCCQAWKISVDEKTKSKWEKLPIPDNMKSHQQMLSDYVAVAEDLNVIQLEENGLCPFLDEKKLCRIVKHYGEEALSHTCHTFPRVQNDFADRTEFSLSMGCPASLDLLWKQDTFSCLEEKAVHCSGDQALYFQMRDVFCGLMNRNEYSVSDVFKMIYFLLLGWYEKEQAGEELEEADIAKAFQPGFLKTLNEAVGKTVPDGLDRFMEQNELFLDLTENYRKKNIYPDVLEPLAQRAGYYEGEKQAGKALKKRNEFERVLAVYDKELRLLMAEELYATLVLPETDLYTMLIKLQWLAMVYGTLTQSLFLFWERNGKLERDDLRQIVPVLIRMTGYTEADIEEYMENSFEEIIWDWGYLALIV